MNLYCEQPESVGATSGMTLMHTPGLTVKYTLPETAVPCLFTVNGRLFAAAANFYELKASGATANIGALNGPPLSPTQIFSCQTHLLILSNGELFIYVLTTFTDSNNTQRLADSFFAVDMTQFNGPVLQIEFCDGYFIAVIQNSNTFQVSNLEDGTTWSGLFISTISYFPDDIVSVIVANRNVGFLSNKKSIVYYNCGAGFPPFIPIQGAFLEEGCTATFATAIVNEQVCWLGQNERGFSGARLLTGSNSSQRISSLAAEFAWSTYPTISDATSYAYEDQKHPFWAINFPSGKATWVYDFLTGLWHRRGFWNQNTASYGAHRSTSHAFAFGTNFVGDWKSGNVYAMSINTFTDFGNPLRWVRRGPMISAENKWVYFPEIEFEIETGLGPIPPLTDGDGQPRDPQVMLRWSNDGTKTWSNTYNLNCGQAGKYNTRVRKTQLGRARKRVFELSGSDPIPWRIVDGYVRAIANGEEIYKSGERLSEQYRKIA